MQPVSWYLNRLSLMSPGEILWRVGQKVSGRLSRADRQADAQQPHAGRVRLDPWPAPVDTPPAPYLESADDILAGRIDLFGAKVEVGFPDVRWHRDPISGVSAPAGCGFDIDYRDVTRVGSARNIWEVNRHFQLVTLGQAWVLCRDARYRQGAQQLLASWLRACPYPVGVNWASTLESGIRLINWYLASRLLELWGEGEPVPGWLDSIRHHCQFIWRRQSRFSSANNHLIGEMAGLYCGASAWPCWPESTSWRVAAKRILEREAQRQVHADGVTCEQAVGYQIFVVQLLIVAGLVGETMREPFSAEYWATVRRMILFLRSIADAHGHLPQFGDSDDGMAFMLAPDARARRLDDLAQFGRALCGSSGRAAPLSAASWLQLGLPVPSPGPTQPEQRSNVFPSGGYFILGANRDEPDETSLVFDAAPLGYLSIAAHGHADCLSFVLSLRGEPVLVDPGTYCYHEDAEWRSYFRGTSAHNTLRVDGLDQSEPGGPFMWLRKANAVVELAHTTGPIQMVRARHDGYCRLADPVVHGREVRLDLPAAHIEVVDAIQAQAPHRLERFWHFAPQCVVELLGPTQVLIRLPRVHVHLQCMDSDTVRILRGSHAPLGGWFSPSFGKLAPTTTVVFDKRNDGATTLRTQLRWLFRD